MAAAAAQLNDDVLPSAVGTGGPVIGVDGLPSNVDHAWAKHDEVAPPAAQPLPCCLARPRFAGPGSPSDSAAREGAAWPAARCSARRRGRPASPALPRQTGRAGSASFPVALVVPDACAALHRHRLHNPRAAPAAQEFSFKCSDDIYGCAGGLTVDPVYAHD